MSKNWNGKITANMSFTCQGLVHIFPWAIGKENYNSVAGVITLIITFTHFVKKSTRTTPTSIVRLIHLSKVDNNFKKLSHGSVINSKNWEIH